jgi:hypothetical protein
MFLVMNGQNQPCKSLLAAVYEMHAYKLIVIEYNFEHNILYK